MDDHDRTEQSTERLPGSGGAWTAGIIVVAVSLLSAFTLADPEAQQVAVTGGPSGDFAQTEVTPGDATDAAGSGPGGVERVQLDAGSEGSSAGGGDAAGSEGGSQQGAGSQANRNYDCSKRQNAGASDVGVSSAGIRLGATEVKTGIAKDFLADAKFGILAVVNEVNADGGICGRQIAVDFENDEWRPDSGSRIINKWIGGKEHFGLLVNPSSEGLRGALDGGLIEQNEFPVIGADGMLIGQYRSDWVWPVATSTYSVMHIMAKDAYDRATAYLKRAGESRKPTFAIVWENNYKFGQEGSTAFVESIKRLCGKGCIKSNVQISGGSTSYANDVKSFKDPCESGGRDFANCDFVAVLMEPATAAQWVSDHGLGDPSKPDERPAVGVGAPQPLFVDSFIRNCGNPCAGMWVWTSFKPPIYPFDNDPAVKAYLSDLRAVSSTADASNPHVQGAYVGAKLFVEALEQLGPAPTRAGIRQVLDQMTFESGLAPPLKFTPDNHFAAVSAQAFEAIFNGSDFNNWQHAKDFVVDDDVQTDLGKIK